MNKPAVLFLCTHNAARSQMAEAIFRRHAGDRFEVFSAGIEPTGIHPLTLRVMEEAGYNLAAHRSKDVSEIMGRHAMRYAFIVCQQAARECPSIFPALLQTIHWPFDDPSACTGTEEERVAEFRRTRDAIEERIVSWLRDHDTEQ